jgi:hypothetical protein
MKYKSAIIFLFSVIFLWLFNCSNNPVSSTVVASEAWRLNDVGTQNYADITLCKLSNGAFSAHGSWYYEFFGYEITCTISSGTATIVDTSVTINTQGTASYPPDSAGHVDSSPFNLQMAGIFKGGVSSGNWEIHFSDTTWEGWINPGRFNGRLQSGSGVTAP